MYLRENVEIAGALARRTAASPVNFDSIGRAALGIHSVLTQFVIVTHRRGGKIMDTTSTGNAINTNDTPTLPALEVVNLQPDGLLPVKYLFSDLEIQITTPWSQLPPSGTSDWITFVWDVKGAAGDEFLTVELKGPITDADFPYSIFISSDYFQTSATVEIFYRIRNEFSDSQVYETSFTRTIIIDKNPPGAGQVLNPAKFLINPITESALSNQLSVEVEVPGDYLDRKTGDTVLCFLRGSDTPPTGLDIHRQAFAPISGPMIVNIPVAEIRKFAGFPILYLFYKLRDRAGNTSGNSLVGYVPIDLTAPPANLSMPEVPAYDSDLLVNRADARAVVSVRVRQYDNAMPDDQCVVEWDGSLLPAVPVNTLPLTVPVPWSVLIAKGANLRRIIDLPVRYYIRRAGDTGQGVRSRPKQVTVDMTIAGQENPLAPALLNSQLALVNIQGPVSNVPNVLDSRDSVGPVRAYFTLFDKPVEGQKVNLFWPGQAAPVATYTVKLNDQAGAVVEFDNPIPWPVIQAAGSNSTTLVYYQTDNGVNQQSSPDQIVAVNLITPVVYSKPSFPQSFLHSSRFLNCDTQPPIWQVVNVVVNPAPNVLKPGDLVVLTWQGFRRYLNEDAILSTAHTMSHVWQAGETSHTFQITDYENLIKPLRDYSAGSAKYSVVRNGVEIGYSDTKYVPIDRKNGAGGFCGPSGTGSE